jgi:molybdopterin molybdotransferase
MSTPPRPIPLAEAQARLLSQVEPLGAEEVAAEAALGRYLAEDLPARRTQPAADLSAMDGYAMRADDLAGPWRIIGRSAAGHPYAGELSPGEAVRISTGALMPAGGGAVLLQEEAERDGDTLRLAPGGEPTSRHIRRAGFDFRTGDPLLTSGARIGPAQLALALSGGHAALSVGRLPSVAVLDSGDELSADPARCAPHQIPASNGAMLAAMAAPFARSVRRIGPVADDLDAMVVALGEAEGADVLVTSGGASVGDHDLVRPALEQWGATLDFWRVAMKPGKPVLVARRGKQWVLGLPGNPVSSYVTAFLFLLPLLRALAGAEERLPMAMEARLNGTLPATGERQEFSRAWFDGQTIQPVNEQDSSALRALAAANALIDRPAHSPEVISGGVLSCFLLACGGIA